MSLLVRTSLVLALFLGSSCQSFYYTTMAQFGVEKRDILIDRVDTLTEAIGRLTEKFDLMTTTYRETIHLEGGDLVEMHKTFAKSYRSSESAAKTVSSRTTDLHSIAGAFFDDWKERSNEIVDEELRRQSIGNFGMVQRNYTELVRTIRGLEADLDPIMTRFNDHVVYLKLNLHSNTLASLQEGEQALFADVEEIRAKMGETAEATREFAELIDY